MLKKLSLSLVLLSIPLQGIALAATRAVPVITPDMVKKANAEIRKEITTAQRTSKWARWGLYGSAGTGLGYLVYRYFFAGAHNNVRQALPAVPIIPVPQNAAELNAAAGQILAEQRQQSERIERIDQRFDRIEQATGLDVKSMGKQLLNILLISAGLSAAYYCVSKANSFFKATAPFLSFDAFVGNEQFLQYCMDLKVRAEEIRIAPFISHAEFDLFMHTYGLLIHKLTRLCGYLTIRASQLQNSQPGVATQLQNTVGTIVHRSTVLAEKLQKNPGIAESAHAVFDFIVVMENVIKQTKHIEMMAVG